MNNSEAAFLGRGWEFPPTFSANGCDVQMVQGNEDIHQSLQILLSTSPHERVLGDDFGCDLKAYLFEEVSQSLINDITRAITDAVLYHEPRINLLELSINESTATSGLLLIELSYSVRSTNSRYNMVYPFYLNEAPGMAGR